MDYSFFAKEIKQRLDTREVFLHYGFKPNNAGFVCCFQHSEKTPSMKVYAGDGGYHCFGCGAHGGVIDFVMNYFGISFKDAVKKINDDFSLGLEVGSKISERKRLEIARSIYEKKKERELVEKEKQKVYDEYYAALDDFIEMDKQIIKYRPKSVCDKLHPKFIEGLHRIEYTKYILDLASERKWNYDKKHR